MRNPPAKDSTAMSMWARDQFDSYLLDEDPVRAMNRALADLFAVQWRERETDARARFNKGARAAVFRDWFTQWKGMVRLVNKYEAKLTEPVTDATFPTLLAAAHPEWFLELYDARVFLTPLPQSLLDQIAALRRAQRPVRRKHFDDPADGIRGDIRALAQADTVFRLLMAEALLRSISVR